MFCISKLQSILFRLETDNEIIQMIYNGDVFVENCPFNHMFIFIIK